MKKIFVLFKKQHPDQRAHAYSVVDEEILKTIDPETIKATKEIGEIEIVKKEDCKAWVLELGGIWYGD